MILIVGKLFRKEAWRLYDTETEKCKDVEESTILQILENDKNAIPNAINAYGCLRGREYMLNKLGFVGKTQKFIILDRIIEDNKIVGLRAVDTNGITHSLSIDEYINHRNNNRIVNNHIRWE